MKGFLYGSKRKWNQVNRSKLVLNPKPQTMKHARTNIGVLKTPKL